MKKILIIGATSTIASACARLWAKEGAHIYLVGRDQDKLNLNSQDLLSRGAGHVNTYCLNLSDISRYENMLTSAIEDLGLIDIALIAHGTLADQKSCEESISQTLQEFTINAMSVIALLTPLANQMIKQGQGSIAVISSVAGDRGRFSNYVYGAAKAAVSAFCEGLRARLYHHNVNLLTIKPGFVASPMTAKLKFPPLLIAKPEKVAKDIFLAINNKKNSIYTPWFWFYIMLIIKNIPGFIFKKIKV